MAYSDAFNYVADTRSATLDALESLRQLQWTANFPDGGFEKPNFIVDVSKYDFSVSQIPATLPDFDSSKFSYDKSTYTPHQDHLWLAEEMATIEAQILAVFTNGGYGISTTLQDAIFRTDRERKLLALNDSLDKVNASFSGRGYRVANHLLTGARNEVITKYQYDMENQSREITKLMEEHARTNWQFAVEKGIAAEEMHANFVNNYDAMFIRMAEAAISKYKLEVETELSIFKAKMASIVTRLDVDKAKIEAGAAAINAMVSKAELDLRAEIADTDFKIKSISFDAEAQISRFNNFTELAKAIAGTAGAAESNINVNTKKLTE